MAKSNNYPLTLEIDYQEKHSRIKTLFRLFLAIPVLIIFLLLIGPGGSDYNNDDNITNETKIEQDCETDRNYGGSAGAAGAVVIPTLLMIVFRKKYPKWWFDWNLEISRFGTRIGSYMLFLRDEYPSTDEEQAIHLNIQYPNVEKDLHRLLPLVKWLFAIPHYIVLALLCIPAIFAVIIAWFSVIFTAKYPRSIFDFIVGIQRWNLRVCAYSFLLVTDTYPPFSLK